MLWTLPLVATQYQPSLPTPAMQAALQAQQEGRFLDALIQLDEAGKDGQPSRQPEQPGADARAGIALLRASFLLQGYQSPQALEILSPLRANAQHAADAHALATMAYLQQGQMQQALDAAKHAHDSGGGTLPHLARSYALQGAGHLAEARETMHDFNAQKSQSAIALAREAELALTLGKVQAARTLLAQAHAVDARHPYVVAVSGLAHLIEGDAQRAKAEFATALQRDPKDARALFGLGLAEIKLGDFEAGQTKLQAANEADPGNALILTYLGRSQQQLGQTGAARESWRGAQQADPKDPTPWLYQAQAELQANQPLDARESLRQAQARTAYRSVYRGEDLLREDEGLLQANLAEIQRRLGMEGLAFHTLSDPLGEKSAANLRNQADVLQGQRFGESARRSLLLQSLFNDRPGNLPSLLDIYGDGAGQTGATVPQHGAVSSLSAQQASFNNYDALFIRPAALEADLTTGGRNTAGEQIRLGVGSDALGLSLAALQFKSDGFAPFDNLDNRIVQGVVQWRPNQATQAFVSHQTFNSRHGEIHCPADPFNCGVYHQLEDNSGVTRLGLRHSLGDRSELRGLISRQQTRQTDNWQWMSDFLPPPNNTIPEQDATYGIDHNSSAAHGVELQYRHSGADYSAQWGVSSVRSPLYQANFGTSTFTNIAQKIYVDWQQALNPYWQLQAGLAWGKNDKLFSLGTADISTYLRRWLPKLGLIYAPDGATHVRLAAWKDLDDAAVGNASLSPAALAGIVLHRPGDSYRLVRGFALDADRRLATAWLLEGRTQRRWTDEPYYSVYQKMTARQVDEARLALHWQSGPLTLTLAYDDENLRNDPKILSPDSVLKQRLRSRQLSLRWLAGAQWTANLSWSDNRLDATQQSSDFDFNPILADVRQRFDQADAGLNWKFNRVGSMDIGVRNVGGKESLYTELDPLAPRFSKGRLAYARVKMGW
ncbi:MAG: tetratricopeptide repeat protein [Sterolibacterium sp.]